MKLKSKSAAKKRFRVTGSGKVVARKGSRGHLLLQKNKRQKKMGKNMIVLKPGEVGHVRRMLPNLKIGK